MARYKLTKKVIADLNVIWTYTKTRWSESQAEKYYQLLINSFEELALHPEFERPYSIVLENLLGFKVGRHIIFYRRIEDNKIEIIRILHEKMDLKNRLKD